MPNLTVLDNGVRNPIPAMNTWGTYGPEGPDGHIEVESGQTVTIGPLKVAGLTRMAVRIIGSNPGTDPVTISVKYGFLSDDEDDEKVVLPGFQFTIPAGATDSLHVAQANIYFPFIWITIETTDNSSFEGKVIVYIQ